MSDSSWCGWRGQSAHHPANPLHPTPWIQGNPSGPSGGGGGEGICKVKVLIAKAVSVNEIPDNFSSYINSLLTSGTPTSKSSLYNQSSVVDMTDSLLDLRSMQLAGKRTLCRVSAT